MASKSNNEETWIHFLSSIERFDNLQTEYLEIETNGDTGCLSTIFANKLLQKETKKQGDLDVSKNQTETPIIKEKNGTIDNIDEPTGPQARRVLFSDRAAISESSDDDEHENLLVNQTETNKHVKETSAQNADANIPEVPQTDTDKDANEASVQFTDANNKEESQISEVSKHIEALVDNKPLSSGKTQHTIYNNKRILSEQKSSSKWNISNIAKHFIFHECVTKLELPTTYDPSSDDTYAILQQDIHEQLQLILGIDLKAEKGKVDSEFLEQLKSVTITEAGSRLVLDALLIPLCSDNGLKIELEKKTSCNFLPHCTFDYCIKKEGNIIGCVEAKSMKALCSMSIAQAVLQLMILQTALKGPNRPEIPVFAIVTDGYRFIYIQLKGLYLGFEHDGVKLKIRKVAQGCGFKDIIRHISFLVNEV